MMRRKSLAFLILLVAFFVIPTMANAGQWEGTIQGLTCVTEGKVCPVGQEDPMVALEENFVLLTENDSWYMLPNVSTNILVRHINSKVMVEGSKSPQYNAIRVDELSAWEGGGWTTVWTPKMQKELEDELWGPTEQ